MEDFAAVLRARGASEQAVEDTVSMFTAQDDGIYDDDAARGASAPTDFRTWCEQELRPRLEVR